MSISQMLRYVPKYVFINTVYVICLLCLHVLTDDAAGHEDVGAVHPCA
jgi:hypothetical protein